MIAVHNAAPLKLCEKNNEKDKEAQHMPNVPNILILPNVPMAFSFGTLRYRSAVSHPDKPEDAIPNKTLSITNPQNVVAL